MEKWWYREQKADEVQQFSKVINNKGKNRTCGHKKSPTAFGKSHQVHKTQGKLADKDKVDSASSSRFNEELEESFEFMPEKETGWPLEAVFGSCCWRQ